MHKKTNKNILLTLFILFSPVFTFAQGQVIDQIIAVVGNSTIMLSEIENQSIQLQNQGYSSTKADIKCEIFEELLIQKLLLNQALLDSIEITPKEIDNIIDARIRYFVSQIGSVEKLEAYYNKSVLEIKESFRNVIKEQELTKRMQSKITDHFKISPSEVKSFFKTIPKDSLPLINSELEIAQITRYPKISDAQKQAVKDRLREFKERINKGDKFSTLAVLYSEDPGSSKKGGELGFMGRGDLVPEFAAVAFNLKEGEISKIVETEFGYHIIQCIEKKGELINFRHILLKPKESTNELFAAKSFLDSIALLIKKDSIGFLPAAEKFSEDIDTKNNGGAMINAQTGNTKFQASQIDPSIYYIVKDMNIGSVSKPFESTDSKGKKVYKMVMLKSKSKAHTANLKDDYQLIQDEALAAKKQEELNKWIKKKQEETYIRIDNSYKNCMFARSGWIK